MKIGILTFHNVRNYGGVLQCYALQQELFHLGFECEVIDYDNQYFKKRYSPFYMERVSLRKIAYLIYAFNSRVKKSQAFLNFRKEYLVMSSTQYTAQNLAACNTEYDAIVVGSDQVWNLELSGMDENYFLGFATLIPRYSYAASFGMESIPEELVDKYLANIKNLDRLSVREISGQKIVSQLCQRHAEVHIDPVFLPDKAVWNRILINTSSLKSKYILVYKINKSDCYVAAKRLQKITGIPVKVINADRTCGVEFEKLKYTSPQEFVRLFYDATYVITDSFHGTAFSIIFKKEFFVYLDKRKNNRNTRQLSLLNRLGLESRAFRDAESIDIDTRVDYTMAEIAINKERQKAQKYLLSFK